MTHWKSTEDSLPRPGQRVRVYTSGCEYFSAYYVEGGLWLLQMLDGYAAVPTERIQEWKLAPAPKERAA